MYLLAQGTEPKRFPALHTIPDETKGSIFSALCDFFQKKFPHERVPPSIFWSFATEWMLKNPKGSPLSVFFRHCETFFHEFFFHKSSPNSPILGNFEVLLLFLSFGYGADLGRSRLVFKFHMFNITAHLSSVACVLIFKGCEPNRCL